jgi:adenylate cyclase
MGIEVERKYLVKSEEWRKQGTPTRIIQGYLLADIEKTVRIRMAGALGFLTIKGISQGFSRKEYEYTIPADEAIEILKLCSFPLIEKFRTKILYEGKTWEVDEFEGENKGLIIAEIELISEDETYLFPPWIGPEVTGDIRYYNFHLAINPFRNW